MRAAHQGAAVDLRELEDAGGGTGLEAYATAPGATLREGRDFQNQAQWRAQRPTVTRRVATDRPLLRALLADPGFTGEEPRALSAEPAWWAELALHYRSMRAA